MSDEYNQKNTPIKAQSSEITSSSSGSSKDIDYVRPAELPEQDLYQVIALLRSGFFVRMQKLLEYNIFLLQYLQELLV